ncbi:MAG: hypothetical protein H8D23_40580 [Candidatus Brocadiales bacterium]|nr:hypothetical protein [Candidatus Brocadiales bacterium]
MAAGISLRVNNNYFRITWCRDIDPGPLKRLFAPWQVKDRIKSPEKSLNIKVSALQKGFLLKSSSFTQTLCTTIPELFSTLEFIITEEARNALEPFLQIHSAIIDLEGKGAMIAGIHGSGKTTLALTAISSGFKALSDEVGIITDHDKTVIGFPRPFRIKDDSLYLSPSVVPSDCYSLPVSDDLSYICFEKYYVPETKLDYIFFPVRRPGDTVLQSVGETETLQQLLPQGFNFYKAPDGRAGDLIKLITKVQVYEILYQDHWDAIARIRDLMSNRT